MEHENKIYLSKLADIYSGYSLRDVSKVGSAGNIYWVQPQNVWTQDFTVLPRLNIKLSKSITILQEQDILLTNRVHFKAATCANLPAKSCLASSAIWIIRVKSSKLYAPFLTFWLNSSAGQRALQERRNAFSTLKSLKKEDLATLAIPLPPIGQQKQLANLYTCCITQHNLQTKKFNLQLKLLDALSTHL